MKRRSQGFYRSVLCLTLLAVAACSPNPAVAFATASTDLALSWFGWYDDDADGQFDSNNDTPVDISNAVLSSDWQYRGTYWEFPGSPVETNDGGSTAVDSSLSISRSSNGGTTTGAASIVGANSTGLTVNMHAESTVNGGLAGADWEQHSEWTQLYNFFFQPGDLIGTTDPETDFYITFIADYQVTSNKDCTGFFCFAAMTSRTN